MDFGTGWARSIPDWPDENLALHAEPSEHPKCIRCWHHREDVGADKEHPEICARCVDNVTGSGETRRFA